MKNIIMTITVFVVVIGLYSIITIEYFYQRKPNFVPLKKNTTIITRSANFRVLYEASSSIPSAGGHGGQSGIVVTDKPLNQYGENVSTTGTGTIAVKGGAGGYSYIINPTP